MSDGPGEGAAFSLAFVHAHAWGVYAGVTLPRVRGRSAGVAAVPDEALAGLVEDERAQARTLQPMRAVSWVGGRLALRAALSALTGATIETRAAILSDDRGAPVLPSGVTGSISHKDTLAVAIAAVADGAGWHLGIDLEELRPGRPDISSRVLTPGERGSVNGPAEVLRCFAAKEAIYKALAPTLRRFVGFQEVETARDEAGAWRATFTPRAGEASYLIELAELPPPLAGHFLFAARARPVGAP